MCDPDPQRSALPGQEKGLSTNHGLSKPPTNLQGRVTFTNQEAGALHGMGPESHRGLSLNLASGHCFTIRALDGVC